MHRHPWRIVRALRVLFACLMLMLPAAPARHAQVAPDTVVFAAYAALQVAAAGREVAPENVEAPRAESEARPTKVASFVPTTEPRSPDPGAAVVPADRWLLHCARLC